MSCTLTQLAIYVRVLIGLFTRTFFQPDEYFQALEPAHKAVFGYGHLTWEWTVSQPIRSIIYPALNVPVYYFLKTTGLSELGHVGDLLLLVGPQILHGSLAACTDVYAGRTARAILGNDYSSATIFISLTSFFHALALSRPLSNSLETSLCTIAFSYYPWDAHLKLSVHLLYNRSKLRKTILFSALACMIRPTNAVIWAYLYANLLWAVRNHRRISLLIIRDILAACFLSIAVLFIVDSLYYGTPTLTQLNFLKRNMSDVSLFYGANAWHYYITQAIPILCTTTLPFTLHGIWTTATSKIVHNTPLRTMLATVIWTVGIYSLAGHKEWRFLHPILPLLHLFAAKSLVDLSDSPRRTKKDLAPSIPKPSLKSRTRSVPQPPTVIHQQFQLPNIPIVYLRLILATVPLSLYIILFYCSGPISVTAYIQSIPKGQLNVTTIGVLMPCHSIPGQAYIHREQLAHGRMWSLGCEPPLNGEDLSTYKDQTNVFFDSPSTYLQTYFPPHVNQTFPLSPFPASLPGVSSTPSKQNASGKFIYPWRHEWPTHLIFFGNLLQEGVRDTLERQGYKEVWKAGREWEGEGDRKGGARVWKWSL